MRNSLTFSMTIEQTNGQEGSKECLSLPALIGHYVLGDPSIAKNLRDCEDNISYIREIIEYGRESLFNSFLQDVSVSRQK